MKCCDLCWPCEVKPCSEKETAIATYRSYLVRVWTNQGRTGPQWSARVEGLQDEQQQQFSDLETLLAFLRLRLLSGIEQHPLPSTDAESVGESIPAQKGDG